MADITGILLAAGQGTRFGANKLSTPLHGVPLLLHSAQALAACAQVIVVIKEGDRELQALIQAAGLPYVINHAAWRGMGSSIACGVQASQHSDGWCILPADMPLVNSDITQRLVDALRQGASIVAPYFHNQRGHPVGFSQRHYASLSELKGEHGARNILAQHADKLQRLDTDDSGVIVDIDTAADLQQLQRVDPARLTKVQIK